ncbi:hypothetical protein [Streptomyces sp. NPDC060065]|uniref:hypothetical protein n=1 Tax=Streptomyces sp. NPDC060065 TaxID=3347050 RepID=UPI0036809A2E
MTDRPKEHASQDQHKAVYQEICVSYRAIDDFRAKLLGFLPLVSGVGAGVLLGKEPGDPKPIWLPVGLFGLVVALGLYAYELYGIRKCTSLIKAGTVIEREWQVCGQFATRPPAIVRLVDEPFAAALVYPAVIAGWLYLALANTSEFAAAIAALALFAVLLLRDVVTHLVDYLREKKEPKAADTQHCTAMPTPTGAS